MIVDKIYSVTFNQEQSKMSYVYDPYFPEFPYATYQASRREIERNIYDLEQRLRIRHEMERSQFEDEMHYAKLRQYEAQLRHRLAMSEEGRHRALAQERLTREQIADRIAEERAHLSHLQNVDRLRREQQLLARQQLADQEQRLTQKLRQKQAEILGSGSKHQRRVSEDDNLAKRYGDGSKAQQYERDLERYYKERICKDKNNSRINPGLRSIEYQEDDESGRKAQQYDDSSSGRSPYRKINDSSQKKYKKGQTSSAKKSYLEDTGTNRKRNSKGQNEGDLPIQPLSISQHLAPTFGKIEDANIMSGAKIKRKIKDFASPRDNERSPYVKKSGRSKSQKKSLRQSRSSQKRDRSKIMNHQLESDAMKKIQNRLKLSAVVYHDSNLRNIKHELNHLFNTYENEVKIRKEVKDKINTNPYILKKHKMVVE